MDWDFGNGETGSGKEPQTVFYNSAGTYIVSIKTDGNNFPKREYIRVHSTPDPGFRWSDTLEMGTFTVVLAGVTQAVDSVDYSYQWLFSDGGTGTARELIHRFPEAGDYQARLTVTHPFGCLSARNQVVTVSDSLDCPNVFTPNEDGRNDIFIVKSNGVSTYSLQVFSRSGALVYKAEAPILMWDGRNLSGQELSPGTYYYVIRDVSGSGRFEKTGFVILYR